MARRSSAALPAEPARSDRDERESGRGGKHWLARLLVYVTPLIAWLLLGVAGVVAWRLWGRNFDARPWFSMLTFAVTCLFTGWVHWLARSRGDAIRLLATVTAALSGIWLICAGILGPTTRPLPDLWLGVGLANCVFWAARRALLSAKSEATGAGGSAGKLVQLLDGARMANPKVIEGAAGKPPVIEAPIEVDRGRQTVKDLQDKAEHVETVLGLRPGAVAIGQHHDAKDAGMAMARFVPVDPLERATMWTGPHLPGESIAEPIEVGTYEDGTRAKVWLPGDEDTGRALAQWLTMGMTGAGKTQAEVVRMASVLCRREVCVWACDPVKGVQSLGPLLAGLDWVALDESTGRQMVAAVKRMIPARSRYLGERGFKQWQPGCGLTLLVLWIEEANWLANSAGLKKLVSECRSVGIVLIISLQRASHTNMDTDTRAQLSGNWCFGVESDIDATMALPDHVIDAGAHPERWGAHRPGYSYLVAPGIPEKYWSVPLRTDWARNDDAVRAAIDTWADVRSPLDEVSRAAAGKVYEDRKQPQVTPTTPAVPDEIGGELGGGFDDEFGGEQEEGTVAGSQLQRTGATGRRPPLDVDDVDDVDGIDDTDDVDDVDDDGQSDDDELPPVGPPIEPDIDVDPHAPIGAPPAHAAEFRFGVPKPARKLDTEQARAVVQQHLRTLLDAGATHTQPADIFTMTPPTTRSREWIRQELDRLCDNPRPGEIGLKRDLDADRPGVFEILPAPAGRRVLAGARG